jgi:YidC/Oxa1 family membrane protein insertase
MEKRIFVAIAVSVAFLWLWAALAPRLFPELARQKTPPKKTSTASTSTGTTATARTSTAPATATPAASIAAPAPVAPIAAARAEDVVVATNDFTARFTNRGAQLVSFQLNNYKNKDGSLVDLVKVRPRSATDFPFAIESRDANVNRRLNTALYQVERRDERGATVLEFRYAAPDGLRAAKTFRFTSPFLFAFEVSVSPAIPFRTVVGPGIRNVDPKGTEGQAALLAGNAIVQEDGDLEVLSREKGDRLRIFESPEFIGVEDNYFLIALRPEHSGPAVTRRIQIGTGKDARPELYAGLTAAGGSVRGSAFFGPKETKLLDNYGLGEALQYGMFGIIARFLLEALVWINNFTKNYGFAIIVLTILIKVVLYPLQHKSIVSMKKMQKVQPKMEAIKNKYKKSKTDPEQRQKMNVEMMQLYQKEGINPMSGCIPILLQLPILWGFYNLLSRAIELRGAHFMLWVKDLSEKDPTYVLPILMTATMFIQTWITPSTGDPAQRRIFLIMPLVFGIMFKEFPSGLVLYWLVQNVLTIAQQMIMNKWWKDHPDEVQTS